jgi:hypothetical protein
VRGDVRRDADRDAHRAVHEQVRELRRQHDGLGVLTVVVRPEVDRVLLEFRQQLLGERLQFALGVPHGRRGVAVERAEVAVTVDERIAQENGCAMRTMAS